MTHSGRLKPRMQTVCPGSQPRAMSAFAARRTSATKLFHEVGAHPVAERT